MSIKLTQFQELLSAVKKFGVINFDETKFEKNLEKKEGLETDLSDIFSTDTGDLFIVLKNGIIRRAVIHIVDISSWRENWKYPRFHINECKKIKDMKAKGRKYRYRASIAKNNKFYLIRNEKQWYEAIKICSYCLTQYNEKYNSSYTKESFPLIEWIRNPMNANQFPKVKLGICTVPNCYTKSWSKISDKRREQVKYTCQECNKDFSDKECQRFLHTHHIDANKRNNIKENLKVLCIECHSKEYHHAHIKKSNQYNEWLKSKCSKI